MGPGFYTSRRGLPPAVLAGIIPLVSPSSDLLDSLRWRYAVKRFDPARRIPDADWAALEGALVLTPSSYGLQPWRFVVITDPALKAGLVPLSWNQPQPADCSHYVVLARRIGMTEADVDRFVARMAEVRGVPASSFQRYRDTMAGDLVKGPRAASIDAWAANQVYIALGSLMTCAAVLGIDACPMEGLQPAKYDEVLGLGAKGYGTVVACALGYRSATDKYAAAPKVRFKAEDVVERR